MADNKERFNLDKEIEELERFIETYNSNAYPSKSLGEQVIEEIAKKELASKKAAKKQPRRKPGNKQ